MVLEEVHALLLAGRPAYGIPSVGPFPGITGVAIYGGTMPNLPDEMIGLYDSTAFEPERTMGGIAQEAINLQVLVRAPKSVDAETYARMCFNILDAYSGVLLGVPYFGIFARSVPFAIGPDENRRYRYSCNYRVNKARS